ncbi:MAG: hypothetical protein LAP85_29200 [Acidobacteriia bacterium]|nr:hypothetical protein [Terriglobia bacterium]
MRDNGHPTFACWPRLLDLHLTEAYSSISASTWRDYIQDGIITAVAMPGSTIRKGNQVVVRARDHRIGKVLLDRRDIDLLISRVKGEQ